MMLILNEAKTSKRSSNHLLLLRRLPLPLLFHIYKSLLKLAHWFTSAIWLKRIVEKEFEVRSSTNPG